MIHILTVILPIYMYYTEHRQPSESLLYVWFHAPVTMQLLSVAKEDSFKINKLQQNIHFHYNSLEGSLIV